MLWKRKVIELVKSWVVYGGDVIPVETSPYLPSFCIMRRRGQVDEHGRKVRKEACKRRQDCIECMREHTDQGVKSSDVRIDRINDKTKPRLRFSLKKKACVNCSEVKVLSGEGCTFLATCNKNWRCNYK
jgi:hypothetical protein